MSYLHESFQDDNIACRKSYLVELEKPSAKYTSYASITTYNIKYIADQEGSKDSIRKLQNRFEVLSLIEDIDEIISQGVDESTPLKCG